MIADSADIRFECSQCGQHLVVESAGAGLTADCPICNTTVTVPKSGTAGRRAVTAAVALEAPRPPFADPVPEDLREELIDASLINGKLVHDLEKAREEIARLQQQLKTVGEECEHLNASTTHTQAELKTFQTERQQFKSELSSLRQKLVAAEETLAEQVPVTDLEATAAKLAEAAGRAAEWEAKAVAAEQVRAEAAAQREEWRSKAEVAGTSLAEALQLAATRDSDLKAAEAAMRQAQKATGEFAAKSAEFERLLGAEKAQREQVESELADQRRALDDSQPQIAALDGELQKTRWRLGEVEAALAGAQESGLRLTTERSELERQLAEAKAQIAEAGDLKALLARSGDELREQAEKLRLAEESVQTLTTRCEQLRKESDGLRRDLNDSHSGREVVEIRARMEDAEAERDRVATRLNAVEADLRAFTAGQAAAKLELEIARTERDDALERVESLRESRAAKDNEVLRGIIARLNSDLSQRAAEVVRLKRARFGLKIAYVLFALGFLAVIAFAIVVLPHALKQ